MLDGMGPYLVPSLIIGLGAWGSAVARAAEAALADRSPALARACKVLALEAPDPAMADLIRAQLRVSRMAEMIRALEQEGLMRLDPVVSPSTHVYFVAAAADTQWLAEAADLAEQAAAELKARVVRVAIVDVGGAPLPHGLPFPVYAVEPVTAQGLVLDAAEYQAAAVEALVALAQPGGSQMLEGRRETGTLGIAWLTWSPTVLRSELARRLSLEVLQRCAAAPPPAVRPAVDLAEGREQALLDGLPFRSDGAPMQPLWGTNPGAQRLRRAAAVLDRKCERWSRRLERNAAARAEREEEALQAAARAALTAGADGLARLRALLEGAARDAARRLDEVPPDPAPAPRVGRCLTDLAHAEALPDAKTAAIYLGAGLLLFTLIWKLAGGGAAAWLAGTLFQLAAYGGYLLWRPWRLRQALAALDCAMTGRAAAVVQAACLGAVMRLDQDRERRCAALLGALEGLPAALNANGDPADAQAAPGALSYPLVERGAAEPVYREMQAHAAELADRLAAAGVLLHWQDPAALRREAEAAIRQALGAQAPPDPAQLAVQAYGERLAERLHALVAGLLDWSQPLLARPLRLPEGRRWLLWPEGLPCPPVPAEVTVLPYARSCVAVLHVVDGLPAVRIDLKCRGDSRPPRTYPPLPTDTQCATS